MPCESRSVAKKFRVCLARSATTAGSSLGPSTPQFQLRFASLAVAIVFAVGLVVFVVVTDQVAQREAVVGRDEVERGAQMPPVVREDVARARQARSQLGNRPVLTAPKATHAVAKAVVPLRPARHEPAELIASDADVPRLGDQLSPRQRRVLRDRFEETATRVEAVCRARQRRRQSKRKPSTCISSTQ